MAIVGNVIVYHGGDMVRRRNSMSYLGGRKKVYECIDFETLILHWINTVVEELGHKDFTIHYRRHNEPLLTGLTLISNDVEVSQMCELAQTSGVCEIYVEHLSPLRTRLDGVSGFRNSMQPKTSYYNNAEAELELSDLFGSNNTKHGAFESERHEGGRNDIQMPEAEGQTMHEEVNAWVDVEIVSDNDNELEDATEKNRGGDAEGPVVAERDYGEDKAGKDSDYPTTSTGSDDEGTPKERQFRVFDPTCEPENIVFETGLIFTNKAEFRKALTEYAVATCTSVHIQKSDKTRIQAKCMEGCPWYIWAARKGRETRWQVKRYVGQHICGKTFDHKGLISSKWIAERFQNKMTTRFRAKDIKNYALEDLRVNVSESQCKKAKRLALEKVNDSQKAGHLIRPTNGETLWKMRMEQMSDRATKKRKRAPNEGKKPGSLSKVGQEQHCRICNGTGHNARSCSATKARSVIPGQEAETTGLGVYSSEDGSNCVNMSLLSGGVHEVSNSGGLPSSPGGTHPFETSIVADAQPYHISPIAQSQPSQSPLQSQPSDMSPAAQSQPSDMSPAAQSQPSQTSSTPLHQPSQGPQPDAMLSPQPHVQKPKRTKTVDVKKVPFRRPTRISQSGGQVT